MPTLIAKNKVIIDRSTVDYMGHYKGYPIAFDAKECKTERMNFKSHLQDHQIEFLKYWKTSSVTQPLILSGFLIQFYELESEIVRFLDIDTLLSKIEVGDKSILREEIDLILPLTEEIFEEYFDTRKNI